MQDDAEVVALCDKFISRSEKQSSTVSANVDMVIAAMREIEAQQDDTVTRFTSKEVAKMVGLMNEGESWNVRKAASYLSKLVRDGVLVKLEPEKGQPTTYSWADK